MYRYVFGKEKICSALIMTRIADFIEALVQS